jgi:hypothetical protein
MSLGSVPFDEVQGAGFTRNKGADARDGHSYKRLIFYSKSLPFVKCCFVPAMVLGEHEDEAG